MDAPTPRRNRLTSIEGGPAIEIGLRGTLTVRRLSRLCLCTGVDCGIVSRSAGVMDRVPEEDV